jgi:hypothetical protein
MRSIVKMVGAALVAACAVSAVAASSALASPEWYVKKGGTYSKVTAAVSVKAAWGLEEIVTPELGEKFGIKCKGSAKGELKSAGVSDITTIEGLSCEKVDGCEKLEETVEPYNTPWQLELYKEGSEIRSKIVSGGNGTPGFRFACKRALRGVTRVETALSTSTHMTNLASGLVEASFDEKSAKVNWSGGGKIEWKGSFLTVEPVEKSGVEAIKVE